MGKNSEKRGDIVIPTTYPKIVETKASHKKSKKGKGPSQVRYEPVIIIIVAPTLSPDVEAEYKVLELESNSEVDNGDAQL